MEQFRQRVRNGEATPFVEVLDHCLGYNATDSRDKVYALVGLSKNARKSVQIDYSKLPCEVYLDTAHYLIAENGFLEVLPHAGIGFTRTHCSDCLPSWVPGWGRDSSVRQLGHAFGFQSMDFNASLGTSQVVQPSPSPRKISLSGFSLDRIAKLATSILHPTSQGGFLGFASVVHDTFAWQDEIEKMAFGMDDAYKTGESSYEALWRTLIGDRSTQSHPAPDIYGTYYELFSRMLSVSRKWLPMLESAMKPDAILTDIEKLIPDLLQELAILNDGKESSMLLELVSKLGTLSIFNAALGGCAGRRRFCITENDFIGFVPPESQIGDEICLFKGCQTPYVLRKNGIDDRHSVLIGECYIHGMLKGEMVGPEENTSVFIIC